MTVAERLGVAKMYDYIEAFGFMENRYRLTWRS